MFSSRNNDIKSDFFGKRKSTNFIDNWTAILNFLLRFVSCFFMALIIFCWWRIRGRNWAFSLTAERVGNGKWITSFFSFATTLNQQLSATFFYIFFYFRSQFAIYFFLIKFWCFLHRLWRQKKVVQGVIDFKIIQFSAGKFYYL